MGHMQWNGHFSAFKMTNSNSFEGLCPQTLTEGLPLDSTRGPTWTPGVIFRENNTLLTTTPVN